MKKEEIIRRYGEDAWEKKLAQRREYYKANKEEENACSKKYREANKEEIQARNKKYREEHPEEVIANNTRSNQEQHRKGGKRYEKTLKDKQTGVPGEKHTIRVNHAKQYKPYKAIIAPESQIHHEWVPNTSEYRGVALVEKEAHMHCFVDVIEILDGEITLRTEEEVKKGEKRGA